MTRKPDIQYIQQFYVYGSEAPAIEVKAPPKKKQKFRLPKPRTEKKILLAFDPVSICGIVVACVMMVLLTIGMFRLSDIHRENLQMETYVISLQNEHVDLEKAYRAGYDLKDIQEKALAIGLVPIDNVQTATIYVSVPEPHPEPTFWEKITWFLGELFA